MGLAPYGNHGSDRVKQFVKTIKEHLIEIKDDGSIWLNQKYFNYATGLRMARDKEWAQLFGFPKREKESDFEQQHCDLGLAIQQITEEVVIKMAKEAKRLTGAKYLCMAGGVALNCVANGKLEQEGIFEEVFIQPAAGDAGGSLGAALASLYIYHEQERKADNTKDSMKGSYLGPAFSEMRARKMAKRYKAIYTPYSDFKELAKVVAGYIAEGNAIGWYQGRMEFGPRALGNRSILGDARNPEMQKKLNLKIKYRESFRPFAPSVLAEKATDYFQLKGDSPYMLLVHGVNDERRKTLPDNYGSLNLRDKLYFLRSDVPAITHIDFSARIQTVHKETNPEYWELIQAFYEQTGYGLVVNTSFNVRGEPIVCTPDDAYRCFMRTEMDYLVIGNLVFKKEEQPNWQEKDNWKEQFVLD